MHRRPFRRVLGLTAALVALASPALARSVTLAWDPNPEPDIAGYIVYRGAICGSYSNTADAGNLTTYTFTSLPDGEGHCFAVQAYNQAGERGPLSDPVSLPAPAASQTTMFVDVPTHLERVSQPFIVAGWAIDLASTNGAGIDMLHVWAYPASGPAVFVGLAIFGGMRPDVGGAFGPRFTNSGFGITIANLAPGPYTIAIFPHSTVSGTFGTAATRAVLVQPAPLMTVDGPAAGSVVSQPFAIDGWSIDPSAPFGTGIDAVNAFAYPNPGSGAAPIFLGWASYGRARGDVGAAYGPRFTNSGFQVPVDGLAPGLYLLEIYLHSTSTNKFTVGQRVLVQVRGRPRMNIDAPANDARVGRSFSVAGWALDLEAPSGAGVDAVHVYASPVSGGSPILLGIATLGGPRPDVAAAFGRASLTNSGFYLLTNTVPPGTYDLIVFARSTVSGLFNAQVRRITVQ